jgi:hypothetical protein
MTAHIRHQHPEKFTDGLLEKLEAQPGAMLKFTEASPGFPDAFMKWLVMTQQPFSTVESPYFQAMIRSLSSRAVIPTRASISTRLLEINLSIKQALRGLVAGMWLACTTDAWTSVANVAYLCLTLHFITADWQLVSMSLDCSPFPGSHDGPSVAAKLNELLEAYGISLNNVVAAVTDTAPNMCRAARFMQYDWHGCMAHMRLAWLHGAHARASHWPLFQRSWSC